MSRDLENIDPLALGAYLQRLRGPVSLTQAARLAGTWPKNLSDWERGDVIPSVPSLYALARAYGVPLESLIARLVPDYRRPVDAHLDEVLHEHLETTPPDSLPPEVLGVLAHPPLGASTRDTMILALVSAPLRPFLAALAEAAEHDADGAAALVATALGELASRLPGTVFTHRDAYPPEARAVLDAIDSALADTATAIAGDSIPVLIGLRVRFASWTEAARSVLHLGGTPVDRREAVVRAVRAAG